MQKDSPIGKILTTERVGNLMWWPTYLTQIACTYLTSLSHVHVWDVTNYSTSLAGVPLASCTGHTEVVTEYCVAGRAHPEPVHREL